MAKKRFVGKVRADSYFEMILNDLDVILDPSTDTGRAAEQISVDFVEEVFPVLKLYSTILKESKQVRLNV
jgi:adenylosuccinate lyase